jgi:cell division protein FtsL
MLTAVPGVTNEIAVNIIGSRPFDSVDDCLEVEGVGKSLLSKLELYAEAQIDESESRTMIPVEEEAVPMYIEKSKSTQENVDKEPSFLSRIGQAIGNFFRALLRFILVTALIVAFGALFYYGLPYITRMFIAPVEQNAAEIDNVENQISELQTQQSEMNSRLNILEDSIETYTVSIQNLEEAQAVLETQLQETNNQVLIELKHEIMMTRALDILARARWYFAQSNFGSAKEDIQSARSLLIELQDETEDEALNQVITRLDLALGNLPAFPVVAYGDLEIAWQILMTGEATVISTPALILAPTQTSTPTPFDVPSVTPTP